MLGLGEEMMNVDEDDKEMLSSSSCCKLVQRLSWEEWDSVRESLFSSSAPKIASAEGCLPVVIDVTASIIGIQQRDPYYRDKDDQPPDVLELEQMLAMLYCLAILRLVNCVVEKTRRKTEVSIGEAANAVGIPHKLIDVHHEGSDRDLPALQVVRDCSDKALDWLKAYYWEPQKMQIPFQGDGNIRSKPCELAFCLNVKRNSQLDSSLIYRKTVIVLFMLYWHMVNTVESNDSFMEHNTSFTSVSLRWPRKKVVRHCLSTSIFVSVT